MTAISTILIDFGDATATPTGHLSAEVDAREEGLNAGVTAFEPGDTAWVLVFYSATVSYTVQVSAGTLTAGTVGLSISRTETVTFADTATAVLATPATAITSVTWLGRALGDLSLGADAQTLTADAAGVAIAEVVYTATADAWSLTSPLTLGGTDDFDILISIIGVAT